ncbi:hypothetical protein DFP72DRAFT_870991 [Ephemerocybe angulata]|uniref:Ribosomal protein s17 n=1 Tax=Ephemerocybe angulata TaxID=980116 RepID=A0A8H6IEM7_9AGAR|nr:hypothetical protein DFP72DRAFT_870991 [Tulosesus angulatus]
MPLMLALSSALDPQIIAKGFARTGQETPTAGQVASLTSTNNYINHCLTVNLPITDGKQLEGGSCNPTPIGSIPSIDKMPTAKFVSPLNGADVGAPNVPFDVVLNIKNLATGQFVNAQANYFAAPQQLNGAGVILGHSHITIDKLTSLDQTTPTDPKKFAYFKGLNAAAQGGKLTANIDKGLPAGAYRLCTINSSSNHQPVIAPVAQHGSLDDCIYVSHILVSLTILAHRLQFTVGGAAGGANNGAAGGASNGTAGGGGAGTNNGGANTGAGKGANGGANNGANNGGNQGANGGANNGGKGRGQSRPRRPTAREIGSLSTA